MNTQHPPRSPIQTSAQGASYYDPQIAPLDTRDRDRFLERFPPGRRSAIANAFLSPIRELHASDPVFVVTAVLSQLYARLKDDWADEQALDNASAAAQIIQEHRAEATAFARYYIEYEDLPQAERERLKAQQREQGRQTYMAAQPPSQKQLSYLHALGYTGEPPTSMQAASAAIDTLLAERRKAVQR